MRMKFFRWFTVKTYVHKIKFILCAVAIATVLPGTGLQNVAQGAELYPGQKWQPDKADYGVSAENQFFVEMDDGVKLFAGVYYPIDKKTGKKAEGNFPVAIEQTPYGNPGVTVVPNDFLVQHGYIYAVVRARGTGKSEGEVAYFGPRDNRDGVCLVDWAAHKLPGSDGNIALVGASYPGGLALGTASLLPKNSPVKAIIASSVGLNQVSRESFMVGGLLTSWIWTYTSYGAYIWGDTPAARRFVDAYVKNTVAGGDWAYEKPNTWGISGSLNSAKEIQKSDIPILFYCGWRDIVESGALRAFTALQNGYAGRPLFAPMQKGQKTTPKYQIIVGNWVHAEGLNAAVYLEWLDTWVKGQDTGLQDVKKPMHLYETNSDRWVNTDVYPIVKDYTVLQLAPGEKLVDTNTQVAPSTSKLKWALPEENGAKLSFTTKVFANGATLAGPISATIYASSSNSNAVIIARLFDIDQLGASKLITKGAVLGSQRKLDTQKSWTDAKGTAVWPWPLLVKDEYMKPGQSYRMDISLLPRQWSILPGHSLRLELTTRSKGDTGASPNLPRDANEERTDPYGLTDLQKKTVPGGIYTIYLGGKDASTLNLPLLAYKEMPETKSGYVPYEWYEHERHLKPTTHTLPLVW
jgi:predicted acyl esterase